MFTIFSFLALAAAGCLDDIPDYWAPLDSLGSHDSGPDGDTDSDTDGDTDTDTGGDTDTDTDGDTDGDTDTDECIDGFTCGDGGTGEDGGSGDAGLLCDSAIFEAYLGGEVHDFDNAGRPFRGNGTDPEVVVTGFSYFLCSHCANAAQMMEDLLADPAYSDRIVYYYRHFSFATDPTSIGLQNHRVAEAAHMQGDFWPVHDALYENFPVTDETTSLALAMASVSDPTTFTVAYSSPESYDAVMADRAAGTAAGVSGTPSLFVNGRQVLPWMYAPEIIDCLLGYSEYTPTDAGVDGGS